MITVIDLKTEETSACINKDVLGSFFKVLRAHAKLLLVADSSEKAEILNENMFSRCLRTSSLKQQTMLVKNEKHLSEICKEEKRNVQKIIHFLYSMVH